MVWSFSTFTDGLQKRLCRFLIHRYLSEFLKVGINLDQLSSNLYSGYAAVRDVEMDVDKLNEILESAKVPIVAVEGYIGEAAISVPWTNLLSKSVDFEVKQLQITFCLQNVEAFEPSGDLVSSMIGSVIDSLATSMELAQNFFNKDVSSESDDDDDSGVEHFAEVIDSIISRFRLTLIDTIIRLETDIHPESGLCTALELQVDWIEVIDELLEYASNETVTTQPHSLSSVPDFNKLFHMKGFRIYADVYSKPQVRYLMQESISSSQTITSMFLRREKKKNPSSSFNLEDCQENDSQIFSQSSVSSNMFESCVSSMHIKDDESFPSCSSALNINKRLESNPVLIVSFLDGLQTVIFRFRNNKISAQGTVVTEKEINLNLSGICAFLCPSQLKILSGIFSKVFLPSEKKGFGKPMNFKDFARVEADLKEMVSQRNRTVDFQQGNWGGSMVFHDGNSSASQFVDQMANVSLGNNESNTFYEMTAHTNFTAISSPKTIDEANPTTDNTSIKISVPCVIIVVSHYDCMRYDEKIHGSSDLSGAAEIISNFKLEADNFFAGISSLNSMDRLKEYLNLKEEFYKDDHLCMVGKEVDFEYSLAKLVAGDLVRASLEAFDFQIFEVLSRKSSVKNDLSSERIKLFSFCEIDRKNSEKQSRLKMTAENDKQVYNVVLNLAPCSYELDISLFHRISSLIIQKSFFEQPLSSTIKNRSLESQGLKSDLFLNALKGSNNSSSVFNITICCPELAVDLRIPEIQLKNDDSSLSHKHRCARKLHKEIVQLKLLDARFEIRNFDFSKISQCGTMLISASSLRGFFKPNSDANDEDESSLFLYAGNLESHDDNSLSVKINYDYRNTSLKKQSKVYSAQSSHYFDNTDPENSDVKSHEGPFSKCVIRNENNQVVVIGNTKELIDFGEACLSNTKMYCEITAPLLRLYIPTRQMYQVLYNRLANDLFLWHCSSNIHQSESDRGNESVDNKVFLPCLTEADWRAMEHNTTPDCCEWKTSMKTNHEDKAHNFCLMVNVNTANLLMGSGVSEEQVSAFNYQLVGDLKQTQFFIVAGFHSNVDLSYAYSISKTANIAQKVITSDVVPYETSVLSINFAKYTSDELQMGPVTDDAFCSLEDENNFSFAVQIDNQSDEHIKNILLGIGIRNTALQLRPSSEASRVWLYLLIDFCSVNSYEIPGYETPEVHTEFHAHISSSYFAYEHTHVKRNSPLSLRIVLGSCDLNSKFVENSDLYKLNCTAEQINLFALTGQQNAASANKAKECGFKSLTNYIRLLSTGMLHLEITSAKADKIAESLIEECKQPLLEIKCKNDCLKMWACSDSLSILINVITELLRVTSSDSNNRNKGAKYGSAVSVERKSFGDDEMMKNAILNESSNSKNQTHETSDNASNFSFDQEWLTRDATRDSVESYRSDEGFCIVDEIPGSGITARDRKPCSRYLPGTPKTNVAELLSLAKAKAVKLKTVPLIKYIFDDISLELHLYGGHDFDNTKPPIKPYSSTVGSYEHVSETCGGKFRDNGVHVEMRFNKVKFMQEIFGDYHHARCNRLFSIGSVEFLDKLSTSKINKLLYRHLGKGFPLNTLAPMFAVRYSESHKSEAKLKISMLPLRVNADQDTIEFLEDFIFELSKNITAFEPESSEPSKFPVLKAESEVATTSSLSQPSSMNPIITNESPQSSRSSSSVDISNENLLAQEMQLLRSQVNEVGDLSNLESQTDLHVSDKRASSDIPKVFFTSFEFSPSTIIRCDFKGKRVRTDRGWIYGFLIGLSEFHCTEIVLHEINCKKGLLGYERCIKYALDVWLNDINNKQFARFITTYGPIKSIYEFGQGVMNLFMLPVVEYRREEGGHIVKGLQRGAESFSISTATAAVDVLQRLFGISVSELAFDIVSPDYPSTEKRKSISSSSSLGRSPNDIRDGLNMAYETVRQEVTDTALVLKWAAKEDRARGSWAVRGLLRQATPTVIRPFVVASKATIQILGGLRNQIQPDSHREEKEKWKTVED